MYMPALGARPRAGRGRVLRRALIVGGIVLVLVAALVAGVAYRVGLPV
jgi:hypothetical protein